MQFKMFQKILLLTLFVLLFQTIYSQQSPKNEQTPNIGQTINGKLYKADRYKGYHLIKVSQTDKKYLFFSLETQQVYQGFNLSLTIFKQGSKQPLVDCLQQQVDSCYVRKEGLEVNKNLLLVVESSQEQIEYKINSYWSDIQHMDVDTEVRFMFSEKQQNQLYHLELEGKEFKELRIIIKPDTRRSAFDKVKMYGTYGANSNPSATTYDFKSFTLWEDSQGVYLYREEIKDLTINLILYGSTKTIYTMRCELVNKTHRDLEINDNIYEYLQSSQKYSYHIKFKEDKDYDYEKFVLRLAIFTGDIDIKFYKDSKKQQPIDGLKSYAYMGDMQYIFDNKTYLELTYPNGLYILIASIKRTSTFMLQFQGRPKQSALKLHEHIYQILPVQKTQLAYFKFGRFAQNKEQNGHYRVVFSDVSVAGHINIQFRYCKTFLNDCLGGNFTANTDKILSEVRKVGSKTTYTLQLTDGMFSALNMVEKNVIIVIVMQNKLSTGSSFSAIEYNIGNRPEFLRENKPIQSHVLKGQTKIYKYVCQDHSLKKIKVHINALSGSLDIYAFRKERNEEEISGTVGKVLTSLVEFTDRLHQDPIVIVIKGLDSATYSIVLQTFHKEENELSYITMSEDVEFKMKIGANKFQIFEIMPILSSLYFSYQATGTLHMCLLNEQMMCQQQNNTSLQSQGELKIKQFIQRKAYIRLRNTLSRVVEVRSIFHSKLEEHCELVKMGILARETLTEGKCLYTIIDKPNDFEVMLLHQEYGQFFFHTKLCNQVVTIPKKLSDQSRMLVTKAQLQQNCKGAAEYTISFVVIGNLGSGVQEAAHKAEDLHIKYLIQYVNSIILLPDGVAYYVAQPYQNFTILKAAYSLLNLVNTSIVLAIRSGVQIFVKVIEKAYRENTTMNITDYHFRQRIELNFHYGLNMKISSEQLRKFNCNECELLIFVNPIAGFGQIIDFTIEITQNYVVLEDGVQKKHYLTEGSRDYFTYNIKQQGKVLIQVSDNNQNCFQVYMGKVQFPNENNAQLRFYEPTRVYENSLSSIPNIYITVVARSDCDYSIGASLLRGKMNLKQLARGILNPLKMKQGEVRYFVFKHIFSTPFKILSLQKYGSVKFFLKKTTYGEVGSLLKSDKIDYESFPEKSPVNNILLVTSNSSSLCKDCYYILAVVANRPTDSSITLVDQEVMIPIVSEKFVNDILPQNGSITKGELQLRYQKGQVEVNIHTGKLSLALQYKNQSFSTSFEKIGTPKPFDFQFDIGKDKNSKMQIMVKAQLPNTIYSLRVYPESYANVTQETSQYKLNPYDPRFIDVDEFRDTKLKGYLKSSQDRIFITPFTFHFKYDLKLLNVTATLEGQAVEITQEIASSCLSIAFVIPKNMSFEKGMAFELSLSMNQRMSFTVILGEQSSRLPENVEVIIPGKKNLTIYSQKHEFLLDIFECKGNSGSGLNNSFQHLKNYQVLSVEMVVLPGQPHAARILPKFQTYLQFQITQLSLVRWFMIDRQKEKGVGYQTYKAGQLKYQSEYRNLVFKVGPVSKALKNAQSQINQIQYNLYISNNSQELKSASQCQKFVDNSVLQFINVYKQLQSDPFVFTIEKNRLTSYFEKAENLYAVLVANVVLDIPADKSQEHYRFIYSPQQIPKEVFTPRLLENYQFLTIVLLVVFTLALIICAFLCRKVFVPMIARLRNQALVEQRDLQVQKDKDIEIKEEIEPPPSSQRRNIATQPPLKTEDKMS